MRRPPASSLAVLLLGLLLWTPGGAAQESSKKRAAEGPDLTAEEILAADGKKSGHVWRHGIVVGADGTAVLPDPVGMRPSQFRDGLGRTSVRITAKGGSLVAVLEPPKTNDEKWYPRGRDAPKGTLHKRPLPFLWQGKAQEKLPPEFILHPGPSLSELPDAGKWWLSAGELVNRGELFRVRKSAPLFAEPFSDEFGAAAGVRRSKPAGLLEVLTDRVTRGFVVDPPPAGYLLRGEAGEADASGSSEVYSFIEGEKPSRTLPGRLRRRWFFLMDEEANKLGVQGKPGTRLFLSGGDIYRAPAVKGTDDLRHWVFPWAMASAVAFVDQFGPAYEAEIPEDASRGKYHWIAPGDWSSGTWPDWLYEGCALVRPDPEEGR